MNDKHGTLEERYDKLMTHRDNLLLEAADLRETSRKYNSLKVRYEALKEAMVDLVTRSDR